MTDRILSRRIAAAERRTRQLRLAVGSAFVWAAAAGTGLIVYLLRGAGVFAGVEGWLFAAVIGGCAVFATLAWAVVVYARTPREGETAARIESRFPSLDAALVTALQQRPGEDGCFGHLQKEVVREARLHSRGNDWRDIVSPRALMLARALSLFAVLAAGLAVAMLGAQRTAVASRPSADGGSDPWVEEDAAYEATIEPGDAEVERGTPLVVLARFAGPVPEEASIVWTPDGGETSTEAMTRALDDPLMSGRVERVEGPLTYSVRYAGQSSPDYRVTVFEYPRLERADAMLTPPAYTGEEPRTVKDVRRLTVVRGTTIELACRLNKSVATARLLGPTGEVVDLRPAGDGSAYAATLTPGESVRYRLELIDSDGRGNRQPPQFDVRVLDNTAPRLERTRPRRDVSVSPLEELDLEATVWDDFGVTAAGVTVRVPGREPVEVELTRDAEGGRKHPLSHRLLLEDAGVAADDLVSYFFWADDVSGDGSPRRTTSDLFFAEVRPFEKVYRKGQPPPGGQQQQQQGQQPQADQLLEVQKQVVAAAWTVLRRESGERTSDLFDGDVATLAESQELALSMTEQAAADMRDERAARFAEEAMGHMRSAAGGFRKAAAERSADPVREGLDAAELAYQSLLKLRAREVQVIRSRQQQSSSSSGSQRQRQQDMQDLELDAEENRYETQSTAQEQQQESEEAREDRQVLNRLRELARRQEDLNEQIAEMQSALQNAETEEERAAAERQLQRLREEQQQIARDAEELQQRMEQPGNRQRMSEQQQQLSEARENARRSSEALEQGQASRAVAEGKRAEEAFRQMQDEMQRRTAGAFGEEVERLSEQAAEAADKEQELSRALSGEPADGGPESDRRPSLRDETPDANDPDLQRQIAEQQRRVGELTEAMRELIEEAEESEPLLADTLYESIRETRDRPPEDALQGASLAIRRGRPELAEEFEKIAAEGLETLRSGIEEAREKIVGDEVESLRRARGELERLRAEIENELARGLGEPPPEGRGGEPSDNSRRPDDGRASDSDQQEGRQGTPSQRQPDGESQQPDEQSGRRGDGQPSEESPQDNRPGQSRDQGQRTGESAQPSEDQTGQPRDGQPGQRRGQQQGGGQQGGGQQGDRQRPSLRSLSDRPGGEQPRGGQPGGRQQGGPQSDGPRQGGRQPGPNRGGEQQRMDRTNRAAPLAGEDYVDWSDRMRDVEEMLRDGELRSEAAGIRDRAKEIRKDSRRRSAEPNWDLVRSLVAEPLEELEREVEKELLRRTSEDLVPIDRSPVPPRFEPQVRRYYERLGAGR